MKFDVVVGNPPYNKIGAEPIYYEFFKKIPTISNVNAQFALITPTGFLIGPNSTDIRTFVLDNYNIQTMIRVSGEVFPQNLADSEKTKTAQPVIITVGQIGSPTTEFELTQQYQDRTAVTSIIRNTDITANGVPLYVGELSKRLLIAAERFSTKFAMSARADGTCVVINFANNSGHYSPTKTLAGYLKGLRAAASCTYGTQSNRHHHECSTQEDAENLCSWLNSAAGRLVHMMWSTTHRTTGTNLGHVPAVIVSGVYTHAKAYDMLGLDLDTITWLTSLQAEYDNLT